MKIIASHKKAVFREKFSSILVDTSKIFEIITFTRGTSPKDIS